MALSVVAKYSFRLFLGTFLGICSIGLSSAADQAIATSQIQIVKTASVHARVKPAQVLATESVATENHSIPFCLSIDAPHSVSTDDKQQSHLTEASTGKTVAFNASLPDSSIHDKSANCLSNPHALEISIDQNQWSSISEGYYAGSLRVMVVIE